MKVTVNRKQLKDALMVAKRHTGKMQSMPITQQTLFVHGESGGLDVIATDLEVGIRYHVDAQTHEPGDGFCVNPKALSALIAKLNCETFDLSHDTAENVVSIQVPGMASAFKMATNPEEEYPAMPVFKDCVAETVSVGVMAGLCRVTHAMSTDETRYNLCSMFVHNEGEQIRSVATDGHRLAVSVPSESASWPLMESVESVMLPRPWVLEVGKQSSLARPIAEHWGIRQDGRNVSAALGPLEVVGRLIDGKYPDFAQVIPQPRPGIQVERETLLGLVEFVGVLDHAVRIEMGALKMRLHTTNRDIGEASESVRCGYDGPPILFGANARYLADALRSFDADTVSIQLNETEPTQSPIRIEAEGAPQFSIIMPMRF